MSDLAKRLREKVSHYECEDCWYSCPKSGECCNENAGTDCTCGADDENALREEAAAALEARDRDAERYQVVRSYTHITLKNNSQLFCGISNLDEFCDVAIDSARGAK